MLFRHSLAKKKASSVTQVNGANVHIDVYIDQQNNINQAANKEMDIQRCKLVMLATQTGFRNVILGSGREIGYGPSCWAEFAVECSMDECYQALFLLKIIAARQNIVSIVF